MERIRVSDPSKRKGFISATLIWVVFALFIVWGLVGCSGKKTAVRDFDGEDENEASVDADVKTGVKLVADVQVAVIETEDFGTIVLELYPNIAPQMVERFKKLVAEGFYNGTAFHRIDARTGLIQGGDPLSKDNDPANDGTGDSPYPNVAAELSDIPFERGTLGAARRGAMPGLTEAQARDTANCQFFITLQRLPQFDEDYTVFGRVIEGINNAEIIMGAPVEPGTDAPAARILIRSITLQPRSKFLSA
jgi:peptidyl-prolyl cis-trans isomerase B (cyclophilin B)